MQYQTHGPYFALKRGDGRIDHPETSEVYIFKSIGPYTSESIKRDGLVHVPVVIQEVPNEDPICQRVMERSLEKQRETRELKKPVFWKEIVCLVVVMFGTGMTIYRNEAGWAAFFGFGFAASLISLQNKMECLAKWYQAQIDAVQL